MKKKKQITKPKIHGLPLLEKNKIKLMTKIKYTVTINFFIFSIALFGQENIKNKLINSVENHLNYGAAKSGKHSFGIAVSTNRFPLIINGNSSFVSTNSNFKNNFGITTFIHNSIFLDYRYNLSGTIFLESGFKYQNFMRGSEINLSSLGGGTRRTLSSAFSAYVLDFGFGYKVIVGDYWRLFDIHFGANFSIIDGPKRQITTVNDNETQISDSNLDGQSYVFSMSESSEIVNKFALAFYYGIAKDICITKNLFVNLRYNRYFGKNNILSNHVFSYEVPELGIKNSVSGTIDTSGKMYTVGIRWVFN